MFFNPRKEGGNAMTGKLYYGDNLAILREHIADESVDLIYLDPPFNSNATYNVLFRAPSGEQSKAQIEAFEDTWHWNAQAEDAYWQVLNGPSVNTAKMLVAMRGFLGENDMMAYLAMMAVRLIELHRVLKPSGSLYLHCDPTASHYLKMLLDGVFGVKKIQNEIKWKRTHAHGDSKLRFANVTDTIFFYSKNDSKQFKRQMTSYSDAYIEKYFRYKDPDGRRYQLVSLRSPNPRPNLTYDYKGVAPHRNGWAVSRQKMEYLDSENRLRFPEKPGQTIREKYYLDEMDGVPVTDLWDDIPPVNSQAKERLGYPTQKPVALLERILAASSNEGDVILDPFCGCGTTVHAAQKLGRQWIGIDITHLAIALIERRLRESFGTKAVFTTYGVPKDLAGAQALADKNKFEFERWAVTLIPDAQPYKSKGGGDAGVDGILYFKTGQKGTGRKETGKAILSVKGGKSIKPSEVRDLKGTIEREKAMIGLFLTLLEPSRQMIAEAAAAGFIENEWGRFQKIQILTIAALLNGERAQVPGIIDSSVYKKAAKEDSTEKDQGVFEV